ncbi:MAG: hypothetical protein EAZ12_02060 [Sphingobacteriia bacterium]|nr:MAG: hypothetical protein EAZ12_02060 [Sphingobacteriia bacterium]
MANILVQWLITATMAIYHPFFVSVLDFNHNAKDATVEISIRVFTDDLEKTLQKSSSAKIDIIQPADKTVIDKQIIAYIGKTLHLKINGQTVNAKYIGYEIIKESTWAYFEIEGVKECKKIDIDCNFLYDFEKSQTNIFHVKTKGQEKSYKLENPQRTTSFQF